MAAGIVRLNTRPGRLRKERAAQLRLHLLEWEAEAPDVVSRMLTVLDRSTAADRGWTFVMISPAQNANVVRWLDANSSRPRVALRLWAQLFTHMRMDTGEITATRKDLAEAAGCSPNHLSNILSEMVRCGALIRHMDGREARFLMNPHVGTHLTHEARERAQAQAPALRVVAAADVQT